jgi:hypothetical protein
MESFASPEKRWWWWILRETWKINPEPVPFARQFFVDRGLQF